MARSTRSGERLNGLPIFEPDVADLARCIEEITAPGCLSGLEETTLIERERLSWDHTRDDYLALLRS